MDTSTIVIGATFGVAGLGAIAAGMAGTGAERRDSSATAYLRSLDGVDDGEGGQPLDDFSRKLSQPFLDRILSPAIGKVVATVSSVTPSDHRVRIRTKLAQAGLDLRRRPEEIIAAQVAGAVIGLLLGIAVLLSGSFSVLLGILATALLLALGAFAPMAWLSRKVDERMQAIREMGLGLTRRDALSNLKQRSQVPELSSFVQALIQADALGMPLGRVLKVQATEMRSKRRQWAGNGLQVARQDPLPPGALHLPGGHGRGPRAGHQPAEGRVLMARTSHVHRRTGPARRSERGASLIEMSLVVGLLALFIFAIITYGLTLSYQQNLTQAANEAARSAAVAPAGTATVRAQAAANRAISGQGPVQRHDEGPVVHVRHRPLRGRHQPPLHDGPAQLRPGEPPPGLLAARHLRDAPVPS